MQLPPPRLTSILLLLTLFLDQMINPLCSLPVCWGKDRARMSLDPVRVTLPVFWNYWTTPTALSKSRDYSTSDICFAFFFFHEEHIYANVEKVRLPSVPLCCVWSGISCYFFFSSHFPLCTFVNSHWKFGLITWDFKNQKISHRIIYNYSPCHFYCFKKGKILVWILATNTCCHRRCYWNILRYLY